MTDIKSIQREYEATAEKLDKLAKELKAAEATKYTSLPAQVGLKTVDALIKALVPYASGITKGKFKAVLLGKVDKASREAPKTKKRKRARLDAIGKEKITAALKAGERTAADIAKDYGVSVATVNIIKSKEGLTKKEKAEV